MAGSSDRFLVDGRARKFDEAVFGGLSVGVRGTVRVLEAVHKQHGRLPWATLFAPAIKLATEGFRVSARLHLLLRWEGAANFAPGARRYFFDQTGSAWPVGYLLKNPEFAATYSRASSGRSSQVAASSAWSGSPRSASESGSSRAIRAIS